MRIQEKYIGQSFPLTAKVPTVISNAQGLLTSDFLWGLLLRVRLRMAITVGAGTAVAAEAPYNFIDRIVVSCQHKVLGDQVIANYDGAYCQVLSQQFSGTPPERYSSPALGVGVANYDISLTYLVPFVRMFRRQISVRGEQLKTLLAGPHLNSLTLTVTPGNGFTLVSGVNNRTLTAFGSAAGSPSLDVTRLVVPLKEMRDVKGRSLANTLRPDLVRRVMLLQDFDATGSLADGFLTNVTPGGFLTGLLIRAGVRPAAGATTEYPAFTSLSDAMVTRVGLKVNQTPNRDVIWGDKQQLNKLMNGNEVAALVTAPNPGYFFFDFATDGTLNDAFDLRRFGSQDQLKLHATTVGAAGQIIQVLQEDVILTKPHYDAAWGPLAA